jgi:flagellin-like hook-associated protein FlgL
MADEQHYTTCRILVVVLELIDDTQADQRLTMTAALSQIEDADPVEAALHLSQQSTAFEAALASTARLLLPTLLDFLR